MRNLYAGLEAIIQTERGKTDCLQLATEWKKSVYYLLIYLPQLKICGLTSTDGKKNGLTIAVKNLPWTLEKQVQSEEGRFIILNFQAESGKITVVSIYASNDNKIKLHRRSFSSNSLNNSPCQVETLLGIERDIL